MNHRRFGPDFERSEDSRRGFQNRYTDRFERRSRIIGQAGEVIDLHQNVSGTFVQSDGEQGRVISGSESTSVVLACGHTCSSEHSEAIVQLGTGHLVCEKCRTFFLCGLCGRDISPEDEMRVFLAGLKRNFHPRCGLRVLEEILWAVRLKKREIEPDILSQYKLLYRDLTTALGRPGLIGRIRAVLGGGGNRNVLAPQ